MSYHRYGLGRRHLLLLPFFVAGAAVSLQSEAASCPRPRVAYVVSVSLVGCATPGGPVAGEDALYTHCALPLGLGPGRTTPEQVCAAIDGDARAALYANRLPSGKAACAAGTVGRALFQAPQVSCRGAYAAPPAGVPVGKEIVSGLEGCRVRQEGNDCALVQVIQERTENEFGSAPLVWKEAERRAGASCRTLFERIGPDLYAVRLQRLFKSPAAIECSDPRLKIWHDPDVTPE